MSISGVTSQSPLDILGLNQTTAQALAQATAKAATATTTGTTSSTGAGLTDSTAGTTFLSLLVKELQNQDPSAPMDSTAMVGQMISLNQLDQLITINQTLSSNATAGSSSGGSSSALSSSTLMAARASLLTNPLTPDSTQAAAASANAFNPVLDLSTLNIPYGGK